MENYLAILWVTPILFTFREVYRFFFYQKCVLLSKNIIIIIIILAKFSPIAIYPSDIVVTH